MSQEVGKFVEKQEVRVEWLINTETLPEGEDLEYTSSVFSLSGSCWCLGISSNNKSEIGVFLRREDWGPRKTIILSFLVAPGSGKFINYGTGIICSLLKNEKRQYSVNKNLWTQFSPSTMKITCAINSEERQKDSLFKRLWNMGLSLRNILAEGSSSDVVLKVKDREIPAHRIILESRCKVFERMSASGMRESRTGVINVVDVEEEILRIVLSYLYSGEPEGLSSKNVGEVYKAAHKYDLPELKNLCTTFMEADLTVDHVCDVIAIAHFYEEAELKACAKKVFAENASRISEMEEWKSFKMKNNALCLELLDYMMKKH